MPLTGDGVVFGPTVEVGEATLDRLRDVCPSVQAATPDQSRDWWPLALTWAKAGSAPARAAAVATPTSAGEVAEVLRVANEARIPVTATAGRSGVCGAAVPVFGGILLDLTALSGIVSVDDESLLVDVLPGTFGDDFEGALRADHGLTMGHWPQSIELSTVGGWLACRSAGQYSTRYGKIEDMVVGLEVALADGTLIRTGGAGPRVAMGPDLTQVFVGSEGTLGVITGATLRLRPLAPEERRAAFVFGSFVAGLDACRRVLRRGATPAVLRLYDERESRRSFATEAGAVLIVLDEAEPVELDATFAVIEQECRKGGRLDGSQVESWFGHRNDVSGLASAIDREIVVDTCEVAARWSVLPALYESALSAVSAVPGTWAVSAHQSHAYADGACLYFTFAGQREGDADGYYRDAWDAVTRTTLSLGGALSHHHGIGLNRSGYLRDALGPAFTVLEGIKRSLDPNGILNPGKLGLVSPFGPAVPWP